MSLDSTALKIHRFCEKYLFYCVTRCAGQRKCLILSLNNKEVRKKIMDEDFGELKLLSFGNWSDDYLNEIDTSKYPFPNTLWHVKPPKEIAIKTSLMLTIVVPGLYLNFVILLVLIKNKWLWSASNILIGNLAFVDFLILLLAPWFMLVRDFYQNYVLKHFGCRFEGYLQASLLLANVGSVILISYDRLAAAVLTAEARVTKNAAPKLILMVWAVALIISIPWITCREYAERQWLDYLEMYCVEDPNILNVYWHFVISLLVWMPLGLMSIAYGAIMWRLECSAKELSSRGGGQLVTRAKGRAMRVTACVLLADVICRIPFSAMLYYRYRNNMFINAVDVNFEIFWFASNTLMFFNCSINPLIYGFTNKRFLKAMDRTPGVSCCKFGSWCCVCGSTKNKELQTADKNTEKIFIIESDVRPNKKLTRMIRNILHINKDVLELSVPKVEEVTNKPTKLTPLKDDFA